MAEMDPTQTQLVQEAVARLQPVLAKVSWTEVRGFVLVNFLYLYSIEFTDGYVINGHEYSLMFDVEDAAMVTAALCDNPRRGWQWWKAIAASGGVAPMDMAMLLDEFKRTIAAHPSVRRVTS